jgi:hypothetical protein
MKRQRGQALLLLAAAMVVIVLSWLSWQAAPAARRLMRDDAAAGAGGVALSALAAWSATRGDLADDGDARPGNLPCPTRDASGNDIGNCSSAGGTSTGRLPWHSLAVPEPMDANGQAVAYVVDDHFRRANLKRAATNSDAGGTAARLGLDDRNLVLSGRQVVAAVERRVLAEARRALSAYAATHAGRYPNAAAVADPACLAVVSDIHDHGRCPASPGLCAGRLPEDALAPYAAPWFTDNAWGRVIAYVVRADVAIEAGGQCPHGLRAAGLDHQYILVAPGSPMPGQTRPSVQAADYFEDAATRLVWQPATDLEIQRPGPGSNDQLGHSP